MTKNDDDMRVLRFIAEHLASPGTSELRTPFDVEELTFEDRVAPALHRLWTDAPGYIEGTNVAEEEYPPVICGLTERGRKAIEGGS